MILMVFLTQACCGWLDVSPAGMLLHLSGEDTHTRPEMRTTQQRTAYDPFPIATVPTF